MLTVAIIVVLVYCFVTLSASSVVLLTSRSGGTAAGQAPDQSVAVIVAARNEEASLPACLSALRSQKQMYPTRYIVVNDHSSDSTSRIAEAFAEEDSRFVALASPPGREGKAAALAHAIGQIDSRLIVTTDADCVPPSGWLAGIVGVLLEAGIDVACGVTVVRGNTLSAKIQRLDWLGLFGVAGALSAVGVPITAMGNNMAIRRDAYEAVGGYGSFLSTPTEDYALFRAVNKLRPGKARLLFRPSAVNETEAETDLVAAFQQRKRWARGGLDASWWVRLIYLIVWASHTLAIAVFFLAPAAAMALIVSIAVTDLVLLISVGRTVRRKTPLEAFPLFEIFKFVYVVAMPFALLFKPTVTWKGVTY